MKTRTVTRYREVPHTEVGETRTITEPYPVEIPVPPRDWDHVVLTGATAVAIAFTGVSVAWSTVSAGALLSLTASPFVAYPAAGAYDAAWLTCMALEWLSRYDPDRARGPRIAGYVFLLIAMAVICVHGAMASDLIVGIAGSVISAIAKILWSLVLRHTAQPLPYRTQALLNILRGEAGAELALAAQRRQLVRVRGQHAAMIAAAQLAEPVPSVLAERDTVGQARDSVRAVQAVLSTVPGLSADEVMEHLTRLGVPYDEDTVRAAVDAERDSKDSSSAPTLRGVPPTITDTIRQSMDNGVEDDTAILAIVRTVHGQAVLPSTVTRIVNRERAARARKGA
ncbi:hypothetical protein [Streptomyces sp. NPDC102264]|uniref:hypothetical protein n=1 Tax=Streptomyces sp. NPDC102264 TaxID=3366149 RepID=UPI0037F39185